MWVYLDVTVIDPHPVSHEFFGEWGRCTTVLQPVLIAMPGAGHTPVYDATFSDWTVLVGAKIDERPDLLAIAKNSDAFSVGSGDDARALIRDGARRPDRNPALVINHNAFVGSPFAPTSHQVEC